MRVSTIKIHPDHSIRNISAASSNTLTNAVNTASHATRYIHSRSAEDDKKISHWPMLPNQRMKRRAHVFSNPNDEPIVGLFADASKIIVADASGAIRFFNPRDGGASLYMMDGLDGITCINLEVSVSE